MDARQLNVICQFSVVLLLAVVSTLTTARTTAWQQRESSCNLIFQHHLLWVTNSTSKVRCAETCASDEHCVTFTFTKMTLHSMTCRGHAQRMTSEGNFAANTMLYDLTGHYYLRSLWLQRPCSSDADCSTVNTLCFRGRCLCTPGYFFSLTQDSCQTECSRLGTDLVMYPHWYVSTNNMDEASISWEACRSWCLSLSTCVSLEYHFGQHKCYLASVTPLQAAPYWREAASNLSYWQRTCA